MGLLDWFGRPPGRDDFARKMIAAIQAGGMKDQIRYDAKEFQLVIGQGQVYHLGNLYDEYGAAKKENREAVLQRFARAAKPVELPAMLDEARPHIVPRIRERFFYEALNLRLRMEGKPPLPAAFLPFTEEYVTELGYDLPDSIMSLTSDHLKKWGTSIEALMDGALGQLRAGTRRKLKTVRMGLYESDWQDNYDACRVLLKDFIRSHEVHGEPVVTIPNRDLLILTGSRDEAGLKALAQRADAALRGPRPILGIPLVLSENRYVPLAPESGMPPIGSFRCSASAPSGRRMPSRSNRSMPSIRENAPMSLSPPTLPWRTRRRASAGPCAAGPRGDVPAPKDRCHRPDPGRSVRQSRQKSKVRMADWDRVASRAGPLLQPTEHFPVRYRVEGFPTAAQLAGLPEGVS